MVDFLLYLCYNTKMSKSNQLPPAPAGYNDSETFLYHEQGGSFGRLPQLNGVEFRQIPSGNALQSPLPITAITPADVSQKAFRLKYIRDQVAKSIRARSASKHFTADDYESEHIDGRGVSLSKTKYHDVNGVNDAAETSDWNAAGMADLVEASECVFKDQCPIAAKSGGCSNIPNFLRDASSTQRKNFGTVMGRVHDLDGSYDVSCEQAVEGLRKLQSKGILPKRQ